jgi:hypothetical protein
MNSEETWPLLIMLYLQIHFSDLVGCSIRFETVDETYRFCEKCLIATSGRSKCEMSCYCTHTVQASVNRDSRCIDQWTNGRMCFVKTHAYWKRPWSISVSALMCEPGSLVFFIEWTAGWSLREEGCNPTWADIRPSRPWGLSSLTYSGHWPSVREVDLSEACN